MSPFRRGFSSGTSDYPTGKGSGRARDAPGVDLRARWDTRERFERVESAWEGRCASALVKVPELGSRKSTNPCQQAGQRPIYRRRTVANSGMDGISAASHASRLKFFELGCQPFISSPGVRVLASQGTMPRENGVTPDGEDKESTDFRRKLRGKMRNLHQTLHGASP